MICNKEIWQYLQKPGPIPRPKTLFDFIISALMAAELAKWSDADPFRKRALPKGLFLFIPPRRDGISIDALLRVFDANGHNCMNNDFLEDVITTPKGPYIMTGVRDGREHLGVSPLASEAKMKKERRTPLTVYEGLIFAIVFRDFCKEFNMNFHGSRYERGSVPCLNTADSAPYLYGNGIDFNNPFWGTPSCASRVGAAKIQKLATSEETAIAA